MQNVFRFLLGFAIAAPLFAQRGVDDIVVTVSGDTQTTGITVSSSSAELQGLAQRAFGAHGRYKLLGGGAAFNLTFTPAGPAAVTVNITKGSANTPVHTETVSGTSLRNALLRAADVAVNKTSGLPGFFAGKLAFVGEATGKTEIYTSDLFFGEAQRWTSDGKQIMGPRWVPGGAKIVFTSYRTSFPDIYVLEMANRRISLLASFKGTNSGGRFSPDGSRVAMVLSGEGNPEVYVGNPQGRQIRRLTTNQAVEASPAWSPDGSRLVFTSDIIATGRPQLHVVSASGGTPTRLVTGFNYCAEPDWSTANPNKIAFTAAQGRGFQVAVYDMSSKKGAVVTKAPADAIEPVWMADGRHLICTFRSANNRRLYLVDSETGKATQISPTSLGNASGATYLAP
jgi:TolB protein